MAQVAKFVFNSLTFAFGVNGTGARVNTRVLGNEISNHKMKFANINKKRKKKKIKIKMRNNKAVRFKTEESDSNSKSSTGPKKIVGALVAGLLILGGSTISNSTTGAVENEINDSGYKILSQTETGCAFNYDEPPLVGLVRYEPYALLTNCPGHNSDCQWIGEEEFDYICKVGKLEENQSDHSQDLIQIRMEAEACKFWEDTEIDFFKVCR